MNKTISFTTEQLNSLAGNHLRRLVVCMNDGQGDTNVWTVADAKAQFIEDCPDWENITNAEYIDMLFEDTNANMTKFIWLEDCEFKIVEFLK